MPSLVLWDWWLLQESAALAGHIRGSQGGSEHTSCSPLRLLLHSSPHPCPPAAGLLAHDLASHFQRELRPSGRNPSEACPHSQRFSSFLLTSGCRCTLPLQGQPSSQASASLPSHARTHPLLSTSVLIYPPPSLLSFPQHITPMTSLPPNPDAHSRPPLRPWSFLASPFG